MFWFFATTVLVLAVASEGFRKFLAIAAGVTLGLGLIALIAAGWNS